jgi:hypothetical protein
VQNKVRDDLVRERAGEIAKARASEIVASLRRAPDFAAAVKRAGLDVKTTDLIARGAAVTDIGVSPEVDKVAFALPVGAVSDAITTTQGTAIIRVVEREDVTDAQVEAGRDPLKDELLNQRRDRFFSAYMQKAKQGMEIETRQQVLDQILGPIPAGQGLPPGVMQ